MNIVVDRKTFTSNSTIGSLSIEGVFECYTLEPTYREVIDQPVASWKVQNQTAIPAGTYLIVLAPSARFKRTMPHLQSVPGYDGVEIHWGNYPRDTDGCTLVGQFNQVDQPDFIGDSMKAFNVLFPKLQAASDAGQTIQITYQGTPS